MNARLPVKIPVDSWHTIFTTLKDANLCRIGSRSVRIKICSALKSTLKLNYLKYKKDLI